MGRPSLFGKKDPAARYQGLMTRYGAQLFERVRRSIAKLIGIGPENVSDGDVFEYLARCSDTGRASVDESLKEKAGK